MPLTPVALIAPDPSDHIAWRLALRRVAADVRSVYLAEAAMLPTVDLWVVVLRGQSTLLQDPTWASCLTARSLLVADATPQALRMARAIRHPVLITRRTMGETLDEQLTLLRDMATGIVFYGSTAPRSTSLALHLAS